MHRHRSVFCLHVLLWLCNVLPRLVGLDRFWMAKSVDSRKRRMRLFPLKGFIGVGGNNGKSNGE